MRLHAIERARIAEAFDRRPAIRDGVAQVIGRPRKLMASSSEARSVANHQSDVCSWSHRMGPLDIQRGFDIPAALHALRVFLKPRARTHRKILGSDVRQGRTTVKKSRHLARWCVSRTQSTMTTVSPVSVKALAVKRFEAIGRLHFRRLIPARRQVAESIVRDIRAVAVAGVRGGHARARVGEYLRLHAAEALSLEEKSARV